MNDNTFEIRVMVVTSGDPAILNRTLASLSQCDKPAAFVETIVVENGAKSLAEDTVNRYRDSLNTRYVFTEVRGKSHALNLGMRSVPRESLVLFTDNDVRFGNNWMQEYANAAKEQPNGFFFGGPTSVDHEGEPPPEWLAPLLPDSAKGMVWESDEQVHSRPFLGFNWAVFARDVLDVGGYKEAIGPGGQFCNQGDETDIQHRLKDAGINPVYVTNAMVWHFIPENRNWDQWHYNRCFDTGRTRAYLDSSRSKIIVLLKIVKRALTWGWLTAKISFQTQAIPKFKTSCKLNNLRGWFSGISQAIRLNSTEATAKDAASVPSAE